MSTKLCKASYMMSTRLYKTQSCHEHNKYTNPAMSMSTTLYEAIHFINTSILIASRVMSTTLHSQLCDVHTIIQSQLYDEHNFIQSHLQRYTNPVVSTTLYKS